MAARIAVIGSNNVDLVTYVTRMPLPGETLEAPSFEMGHGGKGANQAIAAARLGSRVAMVAKVGDDQFADATMKNFSDNGIDTRHVARVSGISSGVAPIFVEPNGENAILIVKGANAMLSPADVDAAAATLKECSLILLQLEVPAETVYRAIAWGRENGVEVLLNPAPALPDLDIERIRDATFMVPNESELAILTGMPVATVEEITAAARSLIARGLRTVVVTMGGRGALMVDGERVARIDAVPVEAVDTTGAGDAFIGAFAHFYANGAPALASLEKAARYAADSITRRGTQKSYATAAAFAEVMAGR